MSQQSATERPPLTAWQSEILRLTAFPGPSAQIPQPLPNWWTDLTGVSPEAKISLPKKEGQQEEGPFESRKLILAVHPLRIDWLFTPFDEQESEGFLTVGSFPESLEIFLRLMFRWFELETCPPIQRLAFGTILLQPVESLNVGYQQISDYLTFKLDPEHSSDFLYQINRPRNSTSGIAGLRINRLSRWSIASIEKVAFRVGPRERLLSVGHFREQPHFACRLELDINTSQDFLEELPKEQLRTIFQELVDLGQEIVERGDVP